MEQPPRHLPWPLPTLRGRLISVTARRKYLLGLVLTALFFNPVSAGIFFAIWPCYVLPSMGSVTWCGYKSAPPYADIQFFVGASLSLVLLAYFAVKWWRSPRS